MTDSQGKRPDRQGQQSKPTDAAFDTWLNRGLHDIFDGIMNEPIPPELLKILQSDQKK